MSNATTIDTREGKLIAFSARPRQGPVEAEAALRIRRTGYPHWLMRAQATGARIPASILHLKMQIEFTAEMLKRLDPLPEDFRADGYWPS